MYGVEEARVREATAWPLHAHCGNQQFEMTAFPSFICGCIRVTVSGRCRPYWRTGAQVSRPHHAAAMAVHATPVHMQTL
jgi:hypothetical protein